ncbi:hypothetical protein GCM10023144_36400 [Pigmentiphaga soli]|uniref:Methylmalonyl-CoA mutase alpha/beta chain catalytic domain-containing protein n=2 Tax=Pigmentiphaga soli TaxID=1007095 RepID=A0ABP8HG66_9BURK
MERLTADMADAARKLMREIDGAAVRREQAARLAQLRAGRDARAVRGALRALAEVAAGSRGNLLEATMAALAVRATVGECTQALEQVWPRHRARAEYSMGAYGGTRGADLAWRQAVDGVARLARAGGRPSILIVKLG